MQTGGCSQDFLTLVHRERYQEHTRAYSLSLHPTSCIMQYSRLFIVCCDLGSVSAGRGFCTGSDQPHIYLSQNSPNLSPLRRNAVIPELR